MEHSDDTDEKRVAAAMLLRRWAMEEEGYTSNTIWHECVAILGREDAEFLARSYIVPEKQGPKNWKLLRATARSFSRRLRSLS